MHYPFFNLSIVFILGLLLGNLYPQGLWFYFSCIFLLICLYVKYRRYYFIYGAFLCFGFLWVSQSLFLPINHMAHLKERINDIRELEGVVVSDITQRQWGKSVLQEFELDIKQVKLKGKWQAVQGKVLIRFYPLMNIQYGDKIKTYARRLEMVVKEDGFDYELYLRRQGIMGVFVVPKKAQCLIVEQHQGFGLKKRLLILRRNIAGIYSRYLPASYADITSAMVLGLRQQMPRDIKDVFVRTGTAHILAISGMNIGIVCAVTFLLLRIGSVSRQASFIITAVLVLMYGLMAGAESSVMRAAFMAVLILAAFLFEEESQAFNALGIAAFILLIHDPWQIWSIGFQLSFAAVIGILLAIKLFRHVKTPLLMSIIVSVGAWLMTAPIMFYHFKQFTPVAILANIPIVPLADLVMVLGLGLALTGHILPWLASAFALCLKAVLSLMILCAHWFSQIPGGFIQI